MKAYAEKTTWDFEAGDWAFEMDKNGFVWLCQDSERYYAEFWREDARVLCCAYVSDFDESDCPMTAAVKAHIQEHGFPWGEE